MNFSGDREKEDEIRVVIVDDTPELITSLLETLNLTEEFRVVGTACDGREGAEVVYASQPDVVILDVDMPVMNGFLCATKIHALGLDPIIIFVSGRDEWADTAEQLGHAFFKKPYDVGKIMQTVLTALR